MTATIRDLIVVAALFRDRGDPRIPPRTNEHMNNSGGIR